MPELPSALPVLGRGHHRSPDRGACFMEYTALLAGESFSDHPRCVDPELATVLRGANDRLSDADRPKLVPMLGRAIGLGLGPRPPRPGWGRPAAERRRRREELARHRAETARLHRAVTARFAAAVRLPACEATGLWAGGGEDVSWLFWDAMDHPTALGRSEDYVRRLVARLDLLHTCYEEALAELGHLPATRVPVPTHVLDDGDPLATPRNG
ncbi:hypothetical protein ACI797_15965 [Geodermatophilus sp. SYSU D00691]